MLTKLKSIFIYILILGGAVGLFLPFWLYQQFGQIEFAAVLFHAKMTGPHTPSDWTNGITIPLLAIVFTCILLIYVERRVASRLEKSIFLLLLAGLWGYNIYHLQLIDYLKTTFTSSSFIEQNYISPQMTKISAPTRNLIMIQVESLESSLQDTAHGGLFAINYIEPLTQLAEKNISFSHSELLDGAVVLPETGWTMAGLIAQTAGIPLKAYKTHTSSNKIGNHFDKYTSFLPGAVTLGDILSDFGYKNYFILGGNKKFAGLDKYLLQHGNYTIYEKESILRLMPTISDNNERWGLYDKDVFAFAKKQLPQITQSPKPFALIIQTIDSHRKGILEPSCSKKYPSQLENVYACVAEQVSQFVSWIMQQPFAQNTTIVVIGDHCNMSTGLFKQPVDPKTGYFSGTQRKVFNLFINPTVKPIKEKNRQFSTMDIFPTILAAMGAQIAGERLGLGTNLFSCEPTLPEKYSYDVLFKELPKKSSFYNRKFMW